MALQAQKGADRQPNVVALRHAAAMLRSLDAAELLEAPMIDLDAPRCMGVLG